MPSSNRTQVAVVREATVGTTPNTPRMRIKLITGESLTYAPTFDTSDELRADRMTGDKIMTGLSSGGTINANFYFPVPNSPEETDLASAFYNDFVSSPSFDNDGTADSVITDAGTTANTYTVASGGAAVKASHLVRATGFANSANNQVFKVASSTATTIVGTGLGLVAEAAPPGTARLKVVGFQGASGDITATATGLASTTLDFTTLGLAVGQQLKPGGTTTGTKFATAACNGLGRITGIAAHAITMDSLPTGWTTDAGTGKTISVWFGDQLKNGTTQIGQTIEKGFLGQSVPTYIVQRGMVVTNLAATLTAKAKVGLVYTYIGMSGGQSTTSLDASPDPAPPQATNPPFACSANVGRVSEGGSTLTGPNFVQELTIQIANNVTTQDSIDGVGPQGLTGHEATITGTAKTYFGDNTLLTKYYAGTPTSLSVALQKGVQMLVFSLPRIIYDSDGSPQATGKNVDVMASFGWTASKDEALTNAMITLDRFEYVEN